MWAVVAAGQPLQSLEESTPAPKGSEVLLRVSHCGVCHSDLYFWKGEYNLGRGKKMLLAERGVVLPRAPGHEVVGEVIAFGPDALGVKCGDRRIIYPWIGCGQCARCRGGQDNLCTKPAPIGVARHGGFASHVIVPDPRFLVDPGSVDPALASTYACSGITAYSAIRKLGDVDPDAAIIVIGAGGLGHTAISILVALNHRNIIVVDIDEAKRASALKAGASAVVDGGRDDLAVELARVAGGPVMYALDFVNTTATAQAAFDSLGNGGILVLVGAAGGTLEISLATMIFRPRSVVGSKTGTIQDLRDVIALAQSGRLKPIPIECVAFDEANDAMVRLESGRVTGRVVLEHPAAN
jgi:alcohol dehydrogenase/propanol-preferring alcohol dehydrogenase